MNCVIRDTSVKKPQENDHVGAKTWLCYNRNRVIKSSVIKGLKCTTNSKAASQHDLNSVNWALNLNQSLNLKSIIGWPRWASIFSAPYHLSSHCCGFEPSSGHVRQAKFCLRVVRCFFSGISRFRSTYS